MARDATIRPPLLKTDQVRCYNAAGQEVSCAGSGQDGETNRMGGGGSARFDTQGGVVTDRMTGLCWQRKASASGFPMTWAEAFEYVAQPPRSGDEANRGWRLPSRRELFSLVSHQYINPALPDGHPFTDVFSGYYWTASACRRLKDQAWYIHLGGGRVYRGMQQGSYMVWPVAGPEQNEAEISDRFMRYGPVLLDRLTERMWLQPGGEMQRPVAWENALEGIQGLNEERVGGYTDWRLPNIRELESLVDLNRHSPALAPGYPIEAVAEGYWSSTTSAYETRYAWVLYPRDGAVGVGYKPRPEFCTLAVRRLD